MEDLLCPECSAPLNEEDLKKSLICPHCKTNLRDKKYLDFLELLVYNDIVEDIDFFDLNLYGDEMLKQEREDFDESEIDPSKYEKRKDMWDEFEDDIELQQSIREELEEDPWDLSEAPIDLEEDEEDYDDLNKKLEKFDDIDELEDLEDLEGLEKIEDLDEDIGDIDELDDFEDYEDFDSFDSDDDDRY